MSGVCLRKEKGGMSGVCLREEKRAGARSERRLAVPVSRITVVDADQDHQSGSVHPRASGDPDLSHNN